MEGLIIGYSLGKFFTTIISTMDTYPNWFWTFILLIISISLTIRIILKQYMKNNRHDKCQKTEIERSR